MQLSDKKKNITSLAFYAVGSWFSGINDFFKMYKCNPHIRVQSLVVHMFDKKKEDFSEKLINGIIHFIHDPVIPKSTSVTY